MTGKNGRGFAAAEAEVTVGRAALTIAALSAVAKIAGFMRDRALAIAFGVGPASDAYMVATWLPGVMVAVVTNAITVSLLPVFTALRSKGDEAHAWRVSSAVLNITILSCGVLTIAGAARPGVLVRLAAPGFSESTAVLTSTLLRLTLPSMLLIGVFAVGSAVLQSYRVFTPSAAGPVLVNLVTIAGIAILGARMGVQGAACGLLGGYVAQALVLLPFLRGRWRSYSPSLDLRDPGVAEVLRLSGPIVGLTAFSQASGLVEKYLASGLEAGSIAALSFANKLVLLPIGLFSVAVSTAMFPVMAEATSRDDYRRLQATVVKGVRTLTYVTLPAAVGLAWLRQPIVRALFEKGAFGSEATSATSSAVLCYSLGMLFLSVSPVLERAFNAWKDTITPSGAGVARILLFILLAGPLSRTMGHSGIALATSVSSGLTCVFLGVILCTRLRAGIAWRGAASFLARLSAGCALMITAASGALRLSGAIVSVTGLAGDSIGGALGGSIGGGRLLPVALAIGCGAAVYFVATALLGVRETWELIGALKSRVGLA